MSSKLSDQFNFLTDPYGIRPSFSLIKLLAWLRRLENGLLTLKHFECSASLASYQRYNSEARNELVGKCSLI